ncbi:11918_t:CDS:2, partial [Ambispora gerdemannii]
MSPTRIAEDMPGESQRICQENRKNIANIDGIADVAYKTHLLVQLDIAITQNKIAKEMADLVIAEVEGGDDYSW